LSNIFSLVNVLRRALGDIFAHYHHAERNHQGKANVLLLPPTTFTARALYNVAKRLEGSCFITIKKAAWKLADKFRYSL